MVSVGNYTHVLARVRVSSERKSKGGFVSPSEFKEARKKLGLSVKEMARAVAVNPRTIRRWEAGGRDIPGAAIIAVQNMMEGVI